MANSDELKNCPVCKGPAKFLSGDGGSHKVVCPRCGEFSIGWQTRFPHEYFNAVQIANLSGWIRENQGCKISVHDMTGLASLRTPSVGEKGEKLLFWLTKLRPKAGEYVRLVFDDYPHHVPERLSGLVRRQTLIKPEFLAFSWTQDYQEFIYVLDEYLERERGFVEFRDGCCYRITPNGWSYIHSLQQTNVQSLVGFIAMWFDKSADPAWTAIEAEIRSSGYEPLRIDRKEHNNKIDDEIVAGIRRSKFLVADFTGHRGGVYFETGFATGLGLPVIWLCRQDELEKTHFDTRQYNFIVWETDKLAELSKALQNRIEATIGRGPLTGNVVTSSCSRS